MLNKYATYGCYRLTHPTGCQYVGTKRLKGYRLYSCKQGDSNKPFAVYTGCNEDVLTVDLLIDYLDFFRTRDLKNAQEGHISDYEVHLLTIDGEQYWLYTSSSRLTINESWDHIKTGDWLHR